MFRLFTRGQGQISENSYNFLGIPFHVHLVSLGSSMLHIQSLIYCSQFLLSFYFSFLWLSPKISVNHSFCIWLKEHVLCPWIRENETFRDKQMECFTEEMFNFPQKKFNGPHQVEVKCEEAIWNKQWKKTSLRYEGAECLDAILYQFISEICESKILNIIPTITN